MSNENPKSQKIRLQKFLAEAGVASRRQAEVLISSGQVQVNGEIVTEMGTKIDPLRDKIVFKGKLVTSRSEHLYIILHKPRGYISTASDPHGRKTVLNLLPEEIRRKRIYPVGRLDYETEGLLLLSNDGEFTLHLTHPRYKQEKEYQVLIHETPSEDGLDKLRKGVLLEGEERPTAPASIRVLSNANGTLLSVAIHEGRNRQVRRMFESAGYEIISLKRVRIGSLRLGSLESGKWRVLRPDEVQNLLKQPGN